MEVDVFCVYICVCKKNEEVEERSRKRKEMKRREIEENGKKMLTG